MATKNRKIAKYPWGIDKYSIKDIVGLAKYLRASLPDKHRIKPYDDIIEELEKGFLYMGDKMTLLHYILKTYNDDSDHDVGPLSWYWSAEVWTALTVPMRDIPLMLNRKYLAGTKLLMKWRLTNGK